MLKSKTEGLSIKVSYGNEFDLKHIKSFSESLTPEYADNSYKTWKSETVPPDLIGYRWGASVTTGNMYKEDTLDLIRVLSNRTFSFTLYDNNTGITTTKSSCTLKSINTDTVAVTETKRTIVSVSFTIEAVALESSSGL